MAAKKIIILTGEIQTGKTTALFNWVNKRKDVAGVLTPVVEGKRFFYSIPDEAYYNMESIGDEEILQVGRFSFSAAQFEKTNDFILKWMNEPAWEYMVIDEIGPLELVQQKGLWTSLSSILEKDFDKTIILVVRKSLYEQVKGLFEARSFNTTVTSTDEFHRFVD